MAVFTESDLRFTFPDEWIVRRYDDTAAYRSLSGHGLKGVDFICLAPGGALWLIEVKNYRIRKERYRALRRRPAELAVGLAKKFADTERLIAIVHRSLARRWHVRLRWWWYARTGTTNPRSNYWFWWETRLRLQVARNVHCLVWMETPEKNADYDKATAAALGPLLPKEFRLSIAEMQRPGKIPLRVEDAAPARPQNPA